MRTLLAAALLLALGTLPAAAQAAGTRADAAWEAGDRELARRLYQGALAENPYDSHAVFRLAQLSSDPRQALLLYQRYVALEPDDAWGLMALGDQLARVGRAREGLAAYDRAARLKSGERDVAIGRARIQSRRGRPAAAAALYEGWATDHPGDQEAWQEAGREWRRAGKPRRATRAFERAVAAGARGAPGQLRSSRAVRAPAIEPSLGYLRDSDGNRTSRLGLQADWEVGDGARLGAAGSVASVGDGVVSHRVQEGSLRFTLGSGSRTQFGLSAGAARLDRGLAGPAWLTPTGEARLRWRAPGARGALVDLRAQRLPLGTTPQLVENRGVRNEARATAELPLGPLRLRAGGRVGSVNVLGETNTRWVGDGAVVLPLGWQGELSIHYHRLHYARPSTLGYFAPDAVETIEGGAYAELDGPGVSLAFDLGSGAQRLQEFGAGLGPWRLALRGWSALTMQFAPGRELRLEVEGYDAPFAPEGVTTSAHWKSLAVSAGIRWAFR